MPPRDELREEDVTDNSLIDERNAAATTAVARFEQLRPLHHAKFHIAVV